MQSYTSRAFELKIDIQTAFGWASQPTQLKPLLEKYRSTIPVKEVELMEEGIKVDTGTFGVIEMARVERTPPHLVIYETRQSPLPARLLVNLSELTPSRTLAQLTIEANVPAFLGSMLKHKVEPILAEVANRLEALELPK